MTKEQAKALLPFIQAFSEGKTIQFKSNGKWVDLDSASFMLTPERYRIKPESKYRPFKDATECWQEMLKHQPFGWLKLVNECVNNSITINISSIGRDDKYPIQFTNDYDDYSFEYLYEEFTFMDGTPFGIIEEDKQ